MAGGWWAGGASAPGPRLLRVALVALLAGSPAAGAPDGDAGAGDAGPTWAVIDLPDWGHQAGCVHVTRLGEALYALRTPNCGIGGPAPLLERHDLRTGRWEALLELPREAERAVVRAVGGTLHIFPYPDGGAPGATMVYDPATGILATGRPPVPECDFARTHLPLDGGLLFLETGACGSLHYDAATGTFTQVSVPLPHSHRVQVLGALAVDGKVHLVVHDLHTRELRARVWEPATGHAADVAAMPSAPYVGPFLEAVPGVGVLPVIDMATWPRQVQALAYDASSSTWTLHSPGWALAWTPAVWADGHGYAFGPAGAAGADVVCIEYLPGCGVEAAIPLTGTPEEPGRAEEPDADHDGVADAQDNCPTVANRGQADADLDGIGDACQARAAGGEEAATGDAPTPGRGGDTDLDGVADAQDNCPATRNADQADLDGDRVGDACDADADGDGIVEATAAHADAFLDNCPGMPNPDQADADGDGVGDACGPMPVARPADASAPTAAAAAASAPDGVPLLALAVGGATAAVFGALLFARRRWPAAVALFSRRLDRDGEHHTRARILQAIHAEPGVHLSELSRLPGLSRGLVRHHVGLLSRAHAVTLVRAGRYTCCYPGSGAAARPADTALKARMAQALDGLVRAQPGVTAADAARALGLTYGAVAYHLRRMEQAGLVRLAPAPLAAFPAVPGADEGAGPGVPPAAAGHGTEA